MKRNTQLVRMVARAMVALACVPSSWAQPGPMPGPPNGLAPVAAPSPGADALRAMLARGETAYRTGDTERALAELQALVALDPRNPRAQLRLGNLYHQAGRDTEALLAYALAAEATASDPGETRIRAKAHMNLALLHLERAERDVAALGQDGLLELQQQGRRIARQLKALPSRPTQPGAASAPALASDPVRAPRNAPATAQSNKGAAVAPTPPAEPAATVSSYTVDRWIGQPRRAPVRSGAARSIVAEPVTESPLPPSPQVESLKGAKGGAR